VNESIDLFRKLKSPQTAGGKLRIFHAFHPIISKAWHRKYDSMNAMNGDILKACESIRCNVSTYESL